MVRDEEMQTLVVDNLVGQVLGNYRVERLMGQGRLNAVYLARHLEHESNVAVTLYILPEKLSSADIVTNEFIDSSLHL